MLLALTGLLGVKVGWQPPYHVLVLLLNVFYTCNFWKPGFKHLWIFSRTPRNFSVVVGILTQTFWIQRFCSIYDHLWYFDDPTDPLSWTLFLPIKFLISWYLSTTFICWTICLVYLPCICWYYSILHTIVLTWGLMVQKMHTISLACGSVHSIFVISLQRWKYINRINKSRSSKLPLVTFNFFIAFLIQFVFILHVGFD